MGRRPEVGGRLRSWSEFGSGGISVSFLHKLPRGERHSRDGDVRTGPLSYDEPGDAGLRDDSKHGGESARLGERSAGGQARKSDAQYATEYAGTGRSRQVPGVFEIEWQPRHTLRKPSA